MKDTQACLKIEHPKLIADIPADDIVKNHLDVIVLSMLIEESMCGYDLIKEIVSRYNVLISQGTVYPLLYSLKEEGILQVEPMKGDMKTKRYTVAPDKRQSIEEKIDKFIRVEESILNSIRKGETYA